MNAVDNQTVRMIVRSTIGGSRARVELSNTFGTTPLAVGAAHIALRSKDSAIVSGTDRTLLFSGKPSTTIPPGAVMLSDATDLDVPKLADLAVSVYIPGKTRIESTHALGLHTTWVSDGNVAGAADMGDGAWRSQSWYWLSSVDVLAPANAAAIVAFGDSITDGATSTANTDRSWPSVLAQRLLANPATADIAVVNEGISGNRVLADGAGVSALARFDRDVLGIAGVKWVMLMEGVNDIGQATRQGSPPGGISADAVIGGLRQLIERAHTHGIQVIGCTLTPYGGAAYSSDAGELIREAVNAFIRTSGATTPLSISKLSPATRPIPNSFSPATTTPTTCIRTTPVIRRWRTPLISRYSGTQPGPIGDFDSRHDSGWAEYQGFAIRRRRRHIRKCAGNIRQMSNEDGVRARAELHHLLP